MANIVAYICNKKKPECCERCTSGLSECTHTLDPEYALNGASTNPGAHPDRFMKVGENEKGESFWEIEDEDDVIDTQWNGPILSGLSEAELTLN